MEFGLKSRLGRWLTHWLVKDLQSSEHSLLHDFDRLCYEIRPGDVILVEGHSRVSNVIKLITQSSWTHAALYVGRLHDIADDTLRERLASHYEGDPRDQLIVEALLGEGTVVYPLHKYRHEHLRICRPKGLAQNDAQAVLAYAIRRLGTDYDLRQLLDLARFMFPFWGFLPRRWRSSLFEHNAGLPTRTVCSSMLAEAFGAVHFPILPFVEHAEGGRIHLHKRNPKLFTPRDFDFSPYFEIIKYPMLGLDDISLYRRLPWGDVDRYCNTLDDCYRDTHRPHDSAPSTAAPETGAYGKTGMERPDTPPPALAAHRGPQSINLLRALRHAPQGHGQASGHKPVTTPAQDTGQDVAANVASEAPPDATPPTPITNTARHPV